MEIKNQLRMILACLVILGGCTKNAQFQQKIVSVDTLKKAILENEGKYTEVKILKVYPRQNLDTIDKKAINLYVCKSIASNDTIYVFDETEKIPSFAKDTSIDIGVSIDKKEVKASSSKEVILFVPKQFFIPKNAIYIYASLMSIGQ